VKSFANRKVLIFLDEGNDVVDFEVKHSMLMTIFEIVRDAEVFVIEMKHLKYCPICSE